MTQRSTTRHPITLHALRNAAIVASTEVDGGSDVVMITGYGRKMLRAGLPDRDAAVDWIAEQRSILYDATDASR